MPAQPSRTAGVFAQLLAAGSSAHKILEEVRGGCPELHVSGLKGSAAAFLCSLLFDMLARQCVMVAGSADDALALYQELLFFRDLADERAQYLPAEVLLFPPLETQPYATMLSHADTSAQRLWTLYRLCEATAPCIVVTSIRALVQKTLPHEVLIDAGQIIRMGDEIDRDRLCAALAAGGYSRVHLAEDRGDFSVRGDVLDVFPPGYRYPVRIDFFGDMVDSIKLFDPSDQRSWKDLREAALVPVREVVLSGPVLADVAARAQHPPLDELFAQGPGKAFYENLQHGLLPSGVEYCLPYVYPRLASFADYCAPDALTLWGDPQQTADALSALAADVERLYQESGKEKRLAAPPQDLFISPLDLSSCRLGTQKICCEALHIAGSAESHITLATQANDDIRRDMTALDSYDGILAALAQRIAQWRDEGCRVLLTCHTASQGERLSALLADYDIDAQCVERQPFGEAFAAMGTGSVAIIVGSLARGVRYPEGLLVIITEEEIFGEKKHRVAAKRRWQGTAISDFSDLAEGDCVVHRENGMGIYRGLRTITAGGMQAEYLTIEYLEGDKLYLPVDRINLITKYEGTEDTLPRLDKLGGTSWRTAKKRVREAVAKIARDLIELYSARKVYEGFAFSRPDHYYREFEAAFPYEETPDQVVAIEDVLRDMSEKKPMDRLICGDVGYGKTEVALRAAFLAVMDGKQVAIFVPTTVLAQQHYQTFTERFKAYPVRAEIISRFRNPKDQKKIIADLAAGKVDIIIGTHRLLSRDITFKDLGLIVIDEEHRFGVTHKEKLKTLKTTVDVLTLTATPIPRTLQLSMLGIRDFSMIETPPEDRLAIRTSITRFEAPVIREAIMRELQRGGQVFFVHDRVRSIPAMAHYLQELVPEVRLGIAHGQMHAHELEAAMLQFLRRQIDVLLCTTIIESGLDFPTANTIIINNAYRLGLAQMYQLRGRVGRGKVRAYAYLLVPSKSILGRDAIKRLEALSEFTELGSGYRLATRDLQIRGAGNILGHAQSGHIAAVGMDMYLELLNQAIKELKGERVLPVVDPEINLAIQAYIPEDYIADANQRLVMYRRIASALDDAEVDGIADELRDRFGKLPEQAATLLEVAKIKNLLRAHLIAAVDQADGSLVFSFHEQADSSLEKILALVASDQQRYRFTPDLKLLVKRIGGPDVLKEIRTILGRGHSAQS